MTSEFTLAPTETFFKENNYFGLEPSNIVMFEQRMIPAVTFDGKVIMQGKGKIAMAPGEDTSADVETPHTLSVTPCVQDHVCASFCQMVTVVCTRLWWTTRCWRT